MTRTVSALFALPVFLAGMVGSLAQFSPAAPEGAIFTAAPAAKAQSMMVAAGHSLAVDAGIAVLREGGSAIDAAVAVQMALTVVEPQSSDGGGVLLYWDAALDSFTAQLAGMDHDIKRPATTSRPHIVTLSPDGLSSGADPRREGVAKGD